MRFNMAKGNLHCETVALLWAGLVLMALYGATPATGAEAETAIYVLFTVDVESRVATKNDAQQDIWGIIPGEPERHGIERMMDILDRHGAKGTFFVNVYETPNHAEGVMATVCRTIHTRGHDVELHTHPAPMFGVGYMQYADLPTQTEILRRGASLLKEWTGVEPVAHRAGGHMANLDTLEACRKVGIPLDFSYNIAWPASSLSSADLTQNAPFVREGVLCVPETAYEQVVGPWHSLRILDIESSSPEEIRKVIADLRQHDVRAVTILMHSFSFSRFGKPNLRVERVFEDLAAGFAADPDVQVVTARQLHDLWRANPGALQGGDFVPTTGWWMTYCRAWQRLDEGWQNAAVALGPIVATCFVGILCGTWWRSRWRRRAASRPQSAIRWKPALGDKSLICKSGDNEAAFWDHAATAGSGFRARFYEAFNEHLWLAMFGAVGDLRGRRVLFVGCGTSSVAAKKLAAFGAEVCCLDISCKSLEQLLSHPFGALRAVVAAVAADAQCMPFGDETFDVVIGKAIVHHLCVKQFMDEVVRVCRPNARIVFSEPLGINPVINLFRRVTPRSRVQTEHPLVRSDLTEIEGRCQRLISSHLFLFSLLSLPWFAVGWNWVASRVFGLGNRVDRALFSLCPPARWLAWNVTLVGFLGEPPTVEA